MNTKDVVAIAIVAHEANRAYCSLIGDHSQKSWSESPSWQKESAVNGVKFHLEALSRGEEVSPDRSHNNWLQEKKKDGWKFGPVKDEEKKEHPCFLPYEQLPKEQQMKDYLFGSIVEGFWKFSTVFRNPQ